MNTCFDRCIANEKRTIIFPKYKKQLKCIGSLKKNKFHKDKESLGITQLNEG